MNRTPTGPLGVALGRKRSFVAENLHCVRRWQYLKLGVGEEPTWSLQALLLPARVGKFRLGRIMVRLRGQNPTA